MQQSTINPFFSSVSAPSNLNNALNNSSNLIQNTTTPKTAQTQSNNECPPHGFLAANQPTLQYYLTPSPKCMAVTSNNNANSAFQGMPEKHRLLHKTSRSLGINQKNQQQQHNMNANNITSILSQSPLMLDVPQSNKDTAALQLRVNHHQLAQTDQWNNEKKDKSSSSLNPKTSSYDLNLSQNQQHFNFNLNSGTFQQQNNPVPASFERSKSTSQLKLPQHDSSSLSQYYGQENLLPNASSLQHSSFFTLPQGKEHYQLLSQSNNQEKHLELKESYSRLPLTPIQRLQGKQKTTKNQVSSFLPSSGLNIDQQQQLLIDSQSILSASSKQPECLLNSSSNSNPFHSNSHSFQLSNNKPSINPISVCSTFNKEVLINQQSNLNKFSLDQMTLENPLSNFCSSNNYVKLNSFLSNNTNHIRNKSTSDKSSTATTLLKLVSPRGAFNIGASTANTEEATTAMETLPSTQCLQSPRRQTLSLWAERCHTTESDYYQQNQKCYLDAKTEESMIDGTVVGLEGIQIGDQLNKTSNAVRNICCSEMIKKSTSDNILPPLCQQQDTAQQINCLMEEMEQLKQINITQKQQEKSTQNANQELKKQIEQLSANLLYMENKLKEIEAENDSLKRENEFLQKNEDNSKQEIVQNNNRIQFLEQTNQAYQKDISDFKQLSHHVIPHIKKENDAQKINDLSQLLDQTNATIQLLQQQLKDKEQTVRESSDKVFELQDKMVTMSEKARQAAEKASEASSRLVEASEDCQRLREQVSQLETQNCQLQSDIEQLASKAQVDEDNQVQFDHWKNAFESLAQPVSLFLREFSKNVLSYSKQEEKQHNSSLAKDLMVFSEGLRVLLKEQIRKKDQLDEKNTIINEQTQFAKELERKIENLQSLVSKQNEDQNRNKELAILRNNDQPEIEDQSQSKEFLLNDQKQQYQHQQNQQQLSELSQEQQLMSIPKKVTEYIQQEQRLFEQKYRERMADVEQEMFKQMHEKDQKITKLNSDNMRLTELNEQRLVEQKILQAHLDRKQEETIRSAKAIEELQKRLETNPASRNNTAQLGKQSSKATEIVLKDRRLQIDSIREEEENEHSIDEEEDNDLETLNNKASFEFQEKQQKQLANEQSQQKYQTQSFQHQQDGLLADVSNQQAMEWKSKLDEKRKVIARLRRELEKCKEKLIDLQEKEFSQESLNRRLAAELETVKASSQDVPKLIEMLKSRKLEYAELKRRFDSMKHERDQAIRILNKPQMEQFNQSAQNLSRQKNRNYSLSSNNNHSLLIQQNLNDSLSSNRLSEPNDSNLSNQRQLIQQQRKFYQQQQQQSNRAHSLSAERNQNMNNLFQAD